MKGTPSAKKRKIYAIFIFYVKLKLFLSGSGKSTTPHILMIFEQGSVNILPKILGLDCWLLKRSENRGGGADRLEKGTMIMYKSQTFKILEI